MSQRELLLISPHRFPTRQPGELPAEEMAAFLNGYLSLWHPTVLQGTGEPPKIVDVGAAHSLHEGQLLVVPAQPGSYLPEDWTDRVKQAGARCYSATSDRAETFKHLANALNQCVSDDETSRPFMGLGLGYLVLHSLAEAMNHLQPLSPIDFWIDMQQAAAATDANTRQDALRAAAQKLKEAREVLYPSTIHCLDFLWLDDASVRDWDYLSDDASFPVHLILSPESLGWLQEHAPAKVAQLQQALANERMDIAAGTFEGPAEALLPITAQWEAFAQKVNRYEQVLGQKPTLYAAPACALSPLTPALLLAFDMKILLGFNLFGTGTLPSFKGPLAEWPSPQGPAITTFVRTPQLADAVPSVFNLAPRLHQTIMEDYSAVLSHFSRGHPSPWYRDWLALHRLTDVFGQYSLLSNYVTSSYASEHPTTLAADEFLSNALHDSSERGETDPIHRWQHAVREQLQQDVERVWPALIRMAGSVDAVSANKAVELEPTTAANAESLAQRLLHSAGNADAGFLVLNPLNMTRTVAVDLPGASTPMPTPARASHVAHQKVTTMVELPPFGFSWLPRTIAPGTKFLQPKAPLAQQWTLRNEFLEAEIDSTTGGLKELRDQKRKIGRLGFQLVFARESSMRAESVQLIEQNAVYAIMRAQGPLLDEHANPLANFQIDYRLEWARPYLDIQIDLQPTRLPGGHSWNDYYALRLAWRDASATLQRNVGWSQQAVGARQFEATQWIELHSGPSRTVLLHQGLPFAQCIGTRMLDLLLVAGNEQATSFRCGLACDVAAPAAAWQDWLVPATVIPASKGPPAIGPTAWLAQVDRPNVLVCQVRPAEKPNAVLFQLAETLGVFTSAKLLCCRDPLRATVVNGWGSAQQELAVQGDAISIELSGYEWQWVEVVWESADVVVT